MKYEIYIGKKYEISIGMKYEIYFGMKYEISSLDTGSPPFLPLQWVLINPISTQEKHHNAHSHFELNVCQNVKTLF